MTLVGSGEKEKAMGELLAEILEAHGGLGRWKQFQSTSARSSSRERARQVEIRRVIEGYGRA